jgi:N-acetylglutamate synthase
LSDALCKNSHMNPRDIETIERATIAAVAPDQVLEQHGWLLPFDTGSVGRAKSAVPLAHDGACTDAILVDGIIAQYVERGLPAFFRLPQGPSFQGLSAHLHSLGYRAKKPTLVQLGTGASMAAVTDQQPADVAYAPDDGWAAIFLGEGFDPVDGAHRVRVLRKATGSVFASVRDGGQTIAAGAGAFSHGWASVHGMRTVQAQRGQGLAGRVLAGIAGSAQQRGIDKVFLQVEESNIGAQALYKRAGFATAWKYVYWQLP